MPKLSSQLVFKHIPDTRDPLPSTAAWRVLIQLSLPREEAWGLMEALLGDAIEKGVVADATICESEAQKAMVWKIRESIARGRAGARQGVEARRFGAGVARGGVHGARGRAGAGGRAGG